MKIALMHFHKYPNPDYKNTVISLRQQGHRVWLGQVNSIGDFEWSDGNGSIESIPRFYSARKSHISSLTNRYHAWRFIRLIRSFLLANRPDIVQINPSTLAWMIPLGMPHAIKFIFDVKQINMGVKSTLASRLRDWLLGISWWFTARFIYDHACFDYPLAARRILGKDWSRWGTSIPVGIDASMLALSIPPFSLDPSQPVCFLYIGAINRFRELDLLLHAIQCVAASTDQFRVDLIGPDNAGGYYQALISQLNIGHVVAIKAPIQYSEVPQVMTKYHVGLAYNPARPTWNFQPTIKILEYCAVGLPIISTDVRAHHDFVKNEENGFLVKNTVEEWASAMLKLVEDRALLKRVHENSQKMRRGVTHEEVAQMHVQVYQKLISPAGISGSLAP